MLLIPSWRQVFLKPFLFYCNYMFKLLFNMVVIDIHTLITYQMRWFSKEFLGLLSFWVCWVVEEIQNVTSEMKLLFFLEFVLFFHEGDFTIYVCARVCARHMKIVSFTQILLAYYCKEASFYKYLKSNNSSIPTLLVI